LDSSSPDLDSGHWPWDLKTGDLDWYWTYGLHNTCLHSLLLDGFFFQLVIDDLDLDSRTITEVRGPRTWDLTVAQIGSTCVLYIVPHFPHNFFNNETLGGPMTNVLQYSNSFNKSTFLSCSNFSTTQVFFGLVVVLV
jgi:hypothetical protein